MIRDLDTSLFRTFAAVADTGGVTNAARQLNLTQAAVSLRMKRLEEAVGLRLFHRGPKGTRLTPEGERLVEHARGAVRMNDAFSTVALSLANDRLIRLGAVPNLVAGWLPVLLKRVSAALPTLTFTLVSAPSSSLCEEVDEGRLDLALIQRQVGEIDGEELHREPLVWVGAEGGSAWRKNLIPVSIAHPLCSYRGAIIAALDAHGCAWEAVPDSESFDARTALLKADAAVGAMQPSLKPPGLEIICGEDRLPTLPAFSTLLYRGEDERSALRSFARGLMEAAETSRTVLMADA